MFVNACVGGARPTIGIPDQSVGGLDQHEAPTQLVSCSGGI